MGKNEQFYSQDSVVEPENWQGMCFAERRDGEERRRNRKTYIVSTIRHLTDTSGTLWTPVNVVHVSHKTDTTPDTTYSPSFGPLFYLILSRNTGLTFLFKLWLDVEHDNEWMKCLLSRDRWARSSFLRITAGQPVWSGSGARGGWPTSTIGRSRQPVGSQGGYRSCRSRSWNHLGHERRADRPQSHLPPPLPVCAWSPSPSASSLPYPCSRTAICSNRGAERGHYLENHSTQCNSRNCRGIN